MRRLTARSDRDVFDGFITGLGSTSGIRVVVGVWPRSPFGSFADVMIERPDGHRILLAPDATVAGYVGATYTFDETRVQPVLVDRDGAVVTVTSDNLRLGFRIGRRTALGALLWTVPRRLARAPRWAAALDPIASRVLPGVHTVGSAGNGRREYYGALDQHRIDGLEGCFEGNDLGTLTAIEPPVAFGFGSVPPEPSIVRIVTTVELAGRAT